MAVWYNEFDRAKAAWLRHLIEEGVIAHGVVDERPIQEVQPDDVRGFTQCHFFAGVGVWSYALRLAGWPDDEPVWTGSCPCGPFSRAGLKKGFDDPRHLWPEWFRLIGERGPHRIFGEQSDAADAWIDLVSADLENHRYAVGSPDIPAAGFGGAHIRQRFFWVADANNAEWWAERAPWNDGFWPTTGRVKGDRDAGDGGPNGGMAHLHDQRGHGGTTRSGKAGRRQPPISLRNGSLADADGWKFGIINGQPGGQYRKLASDGSDADWLFCRDAKWRPVEPGTFPLAYEAPARMGRLRGYGDAIDAEAAAQFITAYMRAAPAVSAAA